MEVNRAAQSKHWLRNADLPAALRKLTQPMWLRPCKRWGLKQTGLNTCALLLIFKAWKHSPYQCFPSTCLIWRRGKQCVFVILQMKHAPFYHVTFNSVCYLPLPCNYVKFIVEIVSTPSFFLTHLNLNWFISRFKLHFDVVSDFSHISFEEKTNLNLIFCNFAFWFEELDFTSKILFVYLKTKIIFLQSQNNHIHFIIYTLS